MANEKLSEWPELTDLDDDDLIATVDVSDTTDSTEGSNKQIVASNVKKYMGGLTWGKVPASPSSSPSSSPSGSPSSSPSGA